MVDVSISTIVSAINYVFSINFFTLISWISLIALMFKFLRKEYLIWSGSGVMNMQDDDEIIPFLRNKNDKPTKCPQCGQSTKIYTVPRPKMLCTKAVFYIYILMIIILSAILCGIFAVALIFPAYYLYVSPYLPTNYNLNSYSNQVNHSTMEIVKDAVIHKNFTTDAIHIPDNYRHLLNITVEEGMDSFMNCSSYLEEGKGLFTLVQDFKEFSGNSETLLKTLPPISEILSGLNATFYPYLEYLPIQVPLVRDVVAFFNKGNYTYAAASQFAELHHVFARDLLQLRVGELMDVAIDPMSLLDAVFVDDVKMIINEFRKNVTDIGSDLKSKSFRVYNRGYEIVNGFLTNEDLRQFNEIPPEFIEMFTAIQSKTQYYRDILSKLRNVLPQFFSCMTKQSTERMIVLKHYVISSYFSYFKIHYFYTIAVIAVLAGVIALIVLVCIGGVHLMKETMNYARSVLISASEEAVDAVNDFGEAMKLKE